MFWIGLYWISTAFCLASAMHVLVCTIFLNVFGQGLALRGPEGLVNLPLSVCLNY